MKPLIFTIVVSLGLVYLLNIYEPDMSHRLGKERSKVMAVTIDALTGCHYLSRNGTDSTLIKRVDDEGKHICTGIPLNITTKE